MTRRMDRVNVLLRDEISRVVTSELKDPRLPSIVSVTYVETSSDMRQAKVFISVLGNDADKLKALKVMKSAAGFIHRNIRKHVSTRSVPSLRFYLDESIERGAELLEVIKDLAPPTIESN